MPAFDAIRWRQVVPLLIVLLIATVLRVGEFGIVRYEFDEMQVTILAKDLVAGRDFPVQGIESSVGLPNTPMTVYIAAIPYLVSSDPVFATLFVALYNVIGVGLLWGFVKRYIGPTPAFIAGLVYAVNPWAVKFSRKIWAQSLLSTLVILAFWLGMLGFIERKRWAQALCLPVLAIIAQIHYSGALLVPVYAWFLWQGRHHLAWRALIISVILCLILVTPFVIGVTRFTDEAWAGYQDVLQAKENTRRLTIDPLTDMHRLITGIGMEAWLAPEQKAEARDAIDAPVLLWELLALAAVAGAVILARQPDHRRSAESLALWIGLPPLLFALGWTTVIFHYFLFEIPALAILVGVCVGWLFTQRARWIQVITVTVLALILVTQIRGWYGILDYVDTHATRAASGRRSIT
jgi:4-amino-4-deoxy-L-arabinose transferase-like glycosyltransferase